MMLSPQAARMGTVFTTLRQIGKSSKLSRSTVRIASRHGVGGTIARFKSTEALEDDYDGELTYRYKGHMSASALRVLHPTTPVQDHDTNGPWTINLGRGNENAQLTGPRNPDEWFTGLAPHQSPGFSHGAIRSLALPNLSAVTRENAKEYFDNSWTLYETLFAGLNGEEGFYRYVRIWYQ